MDRTETGHRRRVLEHRPGLASFECISGGPLEERGSRAKPACPAGRIVPRSAVSP